MKKFSDEYIEKQINQMIKIKGLFCLEIMCRDCFRFYYCRKRVNYNIEKKEKLKYIIGKIK